MGKPQSFEVLVKVKPAPIQCDEQGRVVVSVRLDESKKYIWLVSPKSCLSSTQVVRNPL
jgi:hypothetical protein